MTSLCPIQGLPHPANKSEAALVSFLFSFQVFVVLFIPLPFSYYGA